MYFARLLNKSTTCSSQVTVLTSSVYLLVIFFPLYSPHKLAVPALFHPACAPLRTLFCSGMSLLCWGRGEERRNRCWESLAAPAGVQRTRLASVAALCQVQQLQAPCQWPVLCKDCIREIRAMCLLGDVSLAIHTIYLLGNWSQMELCSSEVAFCRN